MLKKLLFLSLSVLVLNSPNWAMINKSVFNDSSSIEEKGNTGNSYLPLPKKDDQIFEPRTKKVNGGWAQMHPDLIAFYGFAQKNEVQKKENHREKSKIIFIKSSSEEENAYSSISITNTSTEEGYIDSNEESLSDFIEYDDWKPSRKKRKFKRLKKKKRKGGDSSSSSSSESTLFTIDGDCSSEDKPSTPSIDEDYEPSLKAHKSLSRPIVTTRSSRVSKRKNSNSPSFAVAIESEEEDFSDRVMPFAHDDRDFDLVTTMGTQLKLLANVYLANLQGRANIFLPRYSLEVEASDGSFQTIQSFFETPKGEICVFASGGLHHIWEKNIGHINRLFFKKKVKIIRSRWMQKHLQKDKNIKRDLEEEFAGREHELHSEFYYDLFFRHFFAQELVQLLEEGVSWRRLTIHAFSWWDVCDHCEELLSSHKPPIEANFELSYKIAARKRYTHAYPNTSIVEDYALSKTVEGKAWKAIWESLAPYTGKDFANEIFWTKTKDGLEISKWLGQAFRETIKGLDGKAKVTKKGDILAFYTAMQPHKTQDLENLLSYLQDKNWDLSCWYRGPNFPSPFQSKWKRHWQQQIVPHFGWERVTGYQIKEKKRADHCQMCGYEGLMNVYLIFHPKFHASNTFLSLPEEDQKLTEHACGYTFESRVCDFPLPLKQKRKQSISVGSECIQYLCLSKEKIEEWHENHPEAEDNTKWEVDRLASYDALDKAEKNLKGSEKKSRKK
ncbi:MAG: hypothetical protein H0X26_08855 [Alphaproteobacteria bacterium]|nr:hypothetical protein [Alphaproteobacteria bacterium]